MKKLMVVMTIACVAFLAKAEIEWNWWLDKGSSRTDISLGIASRCQEVEALELSLLYSGSPVKNGLQFTFIGLNDSEATCPLQMAFLNRGKDPCAQLGFVNINESSVFDMGMANISDGAKFQLGFLNFNKKGFLPAFIIVNFDPSIFK